MASLESYTALKRVIKMLDRRPKQVFVEAMIVEVRVKRSNKARQQVAYRRRTFGADNVAVGGLGTVSSGDIAGILTGLAGFSLGVTGNVMKVPINRRRRHHPDTFDPRLLLYLLHERSS